MKQRLSVFFLLVLTLWAADFWQAKPYTDWTDKEAQRLLNSSPWAREVELMMAGAPPAGGGGGGGRRGGGPAGDVAPAAPLNLVVRWQTALPVRQAIARIKFGKDAANSADAKSLLDRQETAYVIVVAGVPAMMMGPAPEQLKNALKNQTTLTVKGKGMLVPSEVTISLNNILVDVYFSFPRTAALSLDDKEVEFTTRIGASPVTYKFRLKDMVFGGKLEL